jgi:iron complex outermembrane recepter protein
MRSRLAALLACITISISVPVLGQSTREYRIEIDRVPLASALRQFSLQTGMQVGRLPDARMSETTLVGPVSGRYTAEAALTKLLASSGYSFKQVNERTVAIVATATTVSPRKGVGTGEDESNRKPKSRPYMLAKVIDDERQSELAQRNEEVIVTGSHLSRSGEGPAPITSFDSDVIEQIGASTLPDLLGYVPQQPYNRKEGYRLSGAQYAEIRGLGVDTTLVLINGRRTVPTATSVMLNAFDLNSIALPAVERVEVLSDSASAVYGADAIGGVVNIIMKKEIEEPVLDLKYGAAEGGADERRVSFSAGYSSERFQGGIVLDYFEREYLLGAQRARWSNQDYRRFGSIDQRAPVANPATVSSLTRDNLPGLPSRTTVVPAGSSGVGLTPADFLPTAGQHNSDSLYRYRSIVPETERGSVMAFGEGSVTDDIRAFGELLYADRSTTYQFEPAALVSMTVPSTNPFNPFGVPVAVNYLFTGIGPRAVTADTEFLRGVLGLRGGLRSWDWEASLLQTEEKGSTTRSNEIDPRKVAASLEDPDPTRVLNVFQAGPGGSPRLLASLLAETQVGKYSADGTQASAFLRGPLATLPAGSLDAVVGGEWRNEAVVIDDNHISLSHGRDVSAAFAELRIPVLGGAGTQMPLMKELSLSLAARFDDYSDFGGTFNPQYGAVWRPVADLAVRASYGTSFRPPSLFELYAPEVAVSVKLPDRRRNEEITEVEVVSRGNADLNPMTGDSLTMGLVLTPSTLGGMRIAMNYWRIRMKDRVGGLPADVILADEDRYAGRVSREQPTALDAVAGQPGRLKSIDASRANIGATQTDGVDIEAAHAFHTGIGLLTPRLAATWVHTFRASDSPAIGLIDRVGVASALGTIPRWRAVASLGWSRNALGIFTSVRYIGSYADTARAVPTGRTIASQALVDLQVSLDLGDMMDRSQWQGCGLSAGMLNLFDHEPRFAVSGDMHGFDPSQGDLKQRFVYVRLSKKF